MKNNRTFVNIFALLSICTASFGQENPIHYSQLTLKQCIDIALKNNTNILGKNLDQQTAELGLISAKGNILPFVNANINHGANQGRSIDPFSNSYVNQNVNFANYGLNTSITLFSGFALQDNIKSNKIAVQAAREETQQTKDNLALNVILAYLSILTSQDLLSQANQQKTVTENQLQRLAILDNNGAINPGQLYDLKGQFAGDQLAAVNSENFLNAAVLSLTQMLNIPYQENIQFDRTLSASNSLAAAETEDSVYQTALKNLAILKSVDLRKQSADFSAKANRALRYPSLSLNGGVYTNYSSAASSLQYTNTTEEQTNAFVIIDGIQQPVFSKQDNYSATKLGYGNQFKNNFSTSISLSLSIPLLNGLQTKTRIRTAEIQQQQAKILVDAARITVKQNIAQAIFNLKASQKRLEMLQDQKNAFTQSFTIATARLENGVINTTEYLTIKNNMDRASSNLIIAQYDYILKGMVLDYYKGIIRF